MTGCRIVALLVIGVALWGCSRVSTSGVQPQNNGTTIHGVVRVAVSNDLNTLNPVIGGLAAENAVTEAIFSGLVKIDDRQRLLPDLATEIPSTANGGISADGRTIVYHLRRGVRWQDGKPLTAADVVFTFEKITDPRTNAPNTAAYSHIRAISTPDAHTVVVALKAPWGPAVGQLFCSGENGSIIPKHLLLRSADFNRDPFGLHPIGTGPMRLARWERGSRIVLQANADYFGGAPKIKELDILIIPDANTRQTLLAAKELDVAVLGTPNQVAGFRSLTGYTVRLAQGYQEYYLTFNTQRAPFSDIRVRQALTLALDRPRLVSTSFAGTAILADSLLPPYNWAYNKNNGSPGYDLARANQLLTQAGWTLAPDGVRHLGSNRFAFTILTYSGNPVRAALAAQMQAAWRAVGADASIQAVPANVAFSPTGLLTLGKFDVAVDGLIFDPDPDRAAVTDSQNVGTRGFNAARYTSALSDVLSRRAVAAYPREIRKPLYARLQQLWNHDLPYAPLAWPQAIYVVSADLRGFKPEPINSDFWNVQDWQI